MTLLLALLATTNPLLPSGADPWSIHRDGFYYFTHTTGRNITLYKTRDLADLAKAEKRVVWTPPPDTAYSKQLWAPELHFLQGKWYVYFAADDGQNRNHRMYVLENASPDPLQGEWTFKGKLTTPGDKWSIDGSVFSHRGRLYFIWSGWPGDENGTQNIYICRLKNPWTAEGPRALISTPTHAWERVGDIARPGPDDKPHVAVNEGPQALVRNGRVFIVYSASGCWTDAYALGMIHAPGRANLLNPASWTKHPTPVFAAPNAGGTFAAGHHSFFTSPDGKQDWILYHANPAAGLGCGGRRSPRMQPFSWGADGMPAFGTPVRLDAAQ